MTPGPDTLLVELDGAFHTRAIPSEGRDAEWAIRLRVGKSRRAYMLGVSGPSDKMSRRLLEWLGFEVEP